MPMHYFISAIPFLFLFYVPTATASVDDDVFLAFVKDEPKKFEEFCKDLNEKRELKIGILSSAYYNRHLDFDVKKYFLVQMYKARLGLMYLMRENWNCAEIVNEIGKNQTECKKFRKYLDILYEYLLRVYAAGTETAADQTVKPVFKLDDKVGTLIEILEKLSELSGYFFGRNTSTNFKKPKLSNEGKLNAALSNGTLRVQFDQKLEKMLINTKKNEAIEKAKLHSGSNLIDYQKFKNSAYGASFNIFLDSPFYGKVRQ